MKVVVVESPAKAKTINKYLGSGYEVLASFGHVRDLPPKDGSVAGMLLKVMPLMQALGEDEAVLGAPFYLMKRIPGVIYRAKKPEGFALTPHRVRDACYEFIETLARGGIQSHVQYANSHVGLCLWKTKVGKRHAAMKDRDFFGDVVAASHAAFTAPAIVHQALQIVGIGGYKNDGKFSLGRNYRDALSGALMISSRVSASRYSG